MRTVIALALAAAALTPLAAQAATTRGELARDRAEIREEGRDLRQAVRSGDRRDIRDAREDYREARQEYREDLSDWRDDHGRHNHRAFNRSPRFAAPFAYRGYQPGWQADRIHYGSRYMIAHPRMLGLAPAYGATRWVRHYDDALLVDMRSGKVRRVVRNVF